VTALNLYKPRSVVSRYYTILFTLPKWEFLATALIIIGLLIVVALGRSSIPIVLNSIYTYTTLLPYSKLYSGTVFYKLKRKIGLSLAVLVYSTIFTVITGSPLIAVSASTTLLIVVILGLDGTTPSKYLVSIIPPLATIVTCRLVNYCSTSDVYVYSLVVLSMVFVDIAIFLFMSRRRVNNYSLPDLGTMFLRNWLDRRTEIERAFEDIGEYQHVYPRIIELGDLALIYTDVHYGPFSNIGSSKLPIYLNSALRKIGYRHAIALHGLGSHDRNIVSSKYIDYFIDEIVKTIMSNSKTPLLYQGSFRKKQGCWEALVIVFDKLSLVIISRLMGGIDDLPYDLQLDYELKSKERGLGDVIILDAHNWELLDEPDLSELNALLANVIDGIEAYKGREPVVLQYKYKCFKSSAPGLVDGDCCIICFNGEGRESACILYLRGNNVKPGVRNILLEKLKGLNVDYCEVVTNDEHSETGTRAQIAYIPVHESVELLEDVAKYAVEVAREGWSSGAYLYVSKMDLKLMDGGIDVIKKQLPQSIRESAVLLLLYVFATPLVLFALTKLLCL